MAKTELIVALDTPDFKAAEFLIKELSGLPVIYKIGSSLFTRVGPKAVELAVRHGGRVFLDLKFHDIPNTVKNAVESADSLGVYSVSIHLSGGRKMLEAAAALKSRPLLWGITVLTSFDEQVFAEVGFKSGIEQAINNLAALGASCELDGLVCSPQEAGEVKKRFGAKLSVITPGIRLTAAEDDQARAMTPTEAKAAGADFIVVGRPILNAKSPAEVTQTILEAIK